MDEFERLEAGLSRDFELKKSFGRQAADTLLGCFMNRDDGTAVEQNVTDQAPFLFRQEPIAATLLASTQILLDTVSSITNGISYFFSGNKQRQSVPVQEAPLEIVIDGMSELPESPRLMQIPHSNQFEKLPNAAVASVDDYDGSGFWEDHLEDSLSENGSYYGIDSYIDTSKDHEIIMQPIARRFPDKKMKAAKVNFEPILNLMNSAVINDRVVIKAYLQSGHFDINVRDKIGYTLLHYASAHGHVDLVKYLLDQKAEINLPEQEGWTALHFAAISEQVKICKLLIEKGANVECPNAEGMTPADLTDNLKIKKMIEETLKKKLTAKKVHALYDWDAESEEDLSIKRGEALKIKERSDAWWLVQNESKQMGLVPRIFIQ